MANALLNLSGVIAKINKSGGAHAQGDVCIEDVTNPNAVVNDTSGAYKDGVVWVCVEPAGVANNDTGFYVCSLYAPVINLDTSAALGDFVHTSTTTKKGTPHSAPSIPGDFAQVLGTGTSPAAVLFTVNRANTGVAEELATAETDTSLRLAPDGLGGVEWAAGGGGGATPPPQVDATDISGCIRWVDMDQETGSEGDLIAAVTDYSVTGDTVTQGTGGQKPILRLSVANAKKGAYFDGVDDNLVFGANIDLATNHTILIACAPMYPISAYAGLFQYKQQGMYTSVNSTGYWGLYRSAVGYASFVPGGQVSILGIWGSSNSAYDLIFNHTKMIGPLSGAYDARTTSTIGVDALSGSQCFHGLFFEARVYNAKIAEADLHASIDWLLYKWNGFIRQ